MFIFFLDAPAIFLRSSVGVDDLFFNKKNILFEDLKTYITLKDYYEGVLNQLSCFRILLIVIWCTC